MARLRKNEKNGLGKTGEFCPTLPHFLRIFSHFLPFTHIFSYISLSVFLAISHIFPVSQLPLHLPPIMPPFVHFLIFPGPCSQPADSATASADACM